MTTRRRFSGVFSMGTRRVSQTAMQIKSAVWVIHPGNPDEVYPLAGQGHRGASEE